MNCWIFSQNSFCIQSFISIIEENIQMTASVGYAVVFTIVQFLIKLSIVCTNGFTNTVQKGSQIMVQRIQTTARRWPTDISSAPKKRFSKTGRITLEVALAVWHVAPPGWNKTLPKMPLFNFCEEKFIQHNLFCLNKKSCRKIARSNLLKSGLRNSL